jgi:cytochrome c oxidase cbb3-type subunit 3
MMARLIIALLVLACLSLGLSLLRIERDYRPAPGTLPTGAPSASVSDLHPGGSARVNFSAPPHYRETAAAVSDGENAYENFNCSGCHHHGGGGIGPALMDDTWIYGSSPNEIYKSIAEGRPNGMPAFHDKIPETVLWNLVAYARALGGLVPSVKLPARDDHLQSAPPLSLQDPVQPVSGRPP